MTKFNREASNQPVVAAFDFDGTITTRDCFIPFCLKVAGYPRFLWAVLLALPHIIGMLLRTVSREQAKVRLLHFVLGGRSIKEIKQTAEAFAEEFIPKVVRPNALQRINWHREQGHQVILVSASLENYLIPWAKKVGVDEVLATRLAVVEGSVTGELNGANCRGQEKVERLEKKLGSREKFQLYAYGDTSGDRELLASADFSFYRRLE